MSDCKSDVKTQFYECYYIKKMARKEIIKTLNITEMQYRYLQTQGVKPPKTEITIEFIESEGMKMYQGMLPAEKRDDLKLLLDIYKLKPKPKPKEDDDPKPDKPEDIHEFSK